MSSKRAGEIMIPVEKYPHIPHWFTIRQAVAELSKATIEVGGRISLPRALLVFDKDYHVVLGIVRRRDILRGLEPRFMKTTSASDGKSLFDIEIDPDLAELSSGKIGQAMLDQAEVLVSEIMQPVAESVSHDDHLAKVIYIMVSRDINLLPVLEEGKVIGVVRSVDVFEEIAEMIL
ncbi:MAG: CBS domain-containing protein [FCB group bacterium]|nr:CBS domain-containing protein [FCB group bacterium]